MSKSQGNVIDPWSVLDTRGADALRWNIFSVGLAVDAAARVGRGIDETTRFLLTLWNTYSFFVTYANLDGWSPEPAHAAAASTHVLDRWIRSRLHGTVATVTDALEGFDALRGAQALDALRRRPLELVRPPLAAALLERRARRRARTRRCTRPLAPSRSCSRRSPRSSPTSCTATSPARPTASSVHLTDWPAADAAALDDALEAEMALARAVVSLGLSARNEAKLKVRQPLPRALVLLPDGGAFSDAVAAEIADALNVKQLEAVTDLEGLLDYTACSRTSARLGPKARQAAAAGEGRARRGRRRRGRSARSTRRRLRPRARRRHDRARSSRTTSRCAPSRTRSSRSRRTARTRSRSTRPSTTSCAPRASPASSSARSTTSARPRASRSPTASACAWARPVASKPPPTGTATGSRARCWPSTLDVVGAGGHGRRDAASTSTASRSSRGRSSGSER